MTFLTLNTDKLWGEFSVYKTSSLFKCCYVALLTACKVLLRGFLQTIKSSRMSRFLPDFENAFMTRATLVRFKISAGLISSYYGFILKQ